MLSGIVIAPTAQQKAPHLDRLVSEGVPLVLVDRLVDGVRADTARALFARGLELHPDSPTGLIEHARALLVLEGDERLAEATRLYERAAALEPQDARERLDVELARAGLRD